MTPIRLTLVLGGKAVAVHPDHIMTLMPNMPNGCKMMLITGQEHLIREQFDAVLEMWATQERRGMKELVDESNDSLPDRATTGKRAAR
jgi:hypothetical protein